MRKNLPSFVLCTLIAVLTISLYLGNFSGMKKLQWLMGDTLYSLRGDEDRAADIVLVNIDNLAVNEFGAWPWSYDLLADLVAAINAGQPKSMLVSVDLYSRMSEDTTGNTEILANQVSWVNNIVLTYDFVPAEYSQPLVSRPDYLFNSSVKTDYEIGYIDRDDAINIRKPFLPSDYIMQYADGLGFFHVKFDEDRKVRRSALVANYEGFCYPSAPLLTAALYMGYNSDNIRVGQNGFINMGEHKIPVDDNGIMAVNYSAADYPFQSYSAADVLKENISLDKFKNKLVIIGYTQDYAVENYPTPVSAGYNRPELFASVIENIIHDNYLNVVNLPGWAEALILFGLGLIFAVLLPRINMLYRFIALVVAFIILANLTLILFSSENTLINPLYVALELILLMIAAPIMDQSRLASKFGLNENKVDEAPLPVVKRGHKKEFTNRNSSNENVPTRYLPEDDSRESAKMTQAQSLPGNMMTQPISPKADQKSAARQIIAPEVSKPNSEESEGLSPIEEMTLDQEPAPFNPETNSRDESDSVDIVSSQSPVGSPTGGMENIKNLGRYQIVGVLGKGAMGTVFKGLDPAINRMVALKTIRLDFVSDEEEMKELRDRLIREAQAAGKLSHPNIVTIYDAGSEGTLQYIAMEYLEGQTLEQLIKRRVQFSYKIIAKIISQICLALEYAHDQNIVHRDIKPANIMVLSDYSVKVMDFGIARVDTSSMTKTGIAMGTPNYIAPELLQGKPVDRRADIFSLGVVIYELLTGQRPFKGENLTSLIYSIINNDPEPPSSLNDNMPLIFDHLVAKALAKNPTNRYQKAADMRNVIADFLGSFANKNVGL